LRSFTFTSININFGYAAKIHRDSNNVGLSVLKAFGSFTGGRLRTWADDHRTPLEHFDRAASRSHDVGPGSSGGLLLFDGHDAHEVEDFEGERFSLVYFTAARAAQCPSRDLARLRELLPTAQVSAKTHAQLDLPLYWPNDSLLGA
jgi:hypothetical protein